MSSKAKGRYVIVPYSSDSENRIYKNRNYGLTDLKDGLRHKCVKGSELLKMDFSEFLNIDCSIDGKTYFNRFDFIGMSFDIQVPNGFFCIEIRENGWVYVETQLDDVFLSSFTGMVFKTGEYQSLHINSGLDTLSMWNGYTNIFFKLTSNIPLFIAQDKSSIECRQDNSEIMNEVRQMYSDGSRTSFVLNCLKESESYRLEGGRKSILTLDRNLLFEVSTVRAKDYDKVVKENNRGSIVNSSLGCKFIGDGIMLYTLYIDFSGYFYALYYKGTVFFLDGGNSYYLMWKKSTTSKANKLYVLHLYRPHMGKYTISDYGIADDSCYKMVEDCYLENVSIDDFLYLVKVLPTYKKHLSYSESTAKKALEELDLWDIKVCEASDKVVASKIAKINFPLLKGQTFTDKPKVVENIYSSGEYLVDMDRYTGKDVEGMKKLVDWLSCY